MCVLVCHCLYAVKRDPSREIVFPYDTRWQPSQFALYLHCKDVFMLFFFPLCHCRSVVTVPLLLYSNSFRQLLTPAFGAIVSSHCCFLSFFFGMEWGVFSLQPCLSVPLSLNVCVCVWHLSSMD